MTKDGVIDSKFQFRAGMRDDFHAAATVESSVFLSFHTFM